MDRFRHWCNSPGLAEVGRDPVFADAGRDPALAEVGLDPVLAEVGLEVGLASPSSIGPESNWKKNICNSSLVLKVE